MITSTAFWDKTFNHNAVLDETDKYFRTRRRVFKLRHRKRFTVVCSHHHPSDTLFLCPTVLYPRPLTLCVGSVMHIYLYRPLYIYINNCQNKHNLVQNSMAALLPRGHVYTCLFVFDMLARSQHTLAKINVQTSPRWAHTAFGGIRILLVLHSLCVPYSPCIQTPEPT